MSAAPEHGCLVLRLGAIGDTVLAIPALRALRQRHRRVVLVGSKAAVVLLSRVVDRVVDVESAAAAALFRSDSSADADLIAAAGPVDRAVVWLNHPGEVVAALQRLGIPPIVVAPSVPSARQHVVDHLLASIGEPGGARVDLPVAPEERARAAAVLAERGVPLGSVLLAVGAGSRAKRWPIERFAALADEVPRPVAVLAGPAERDAVAALQRARPHLPVIADVDLALLPAVLAQATAVVANDSGPGHLAAAVGTPVIALFGPTDPVVWAPRGARVEVLQAEGGALGSISVEVVSAALARVLA